ncbi:MAG TPA: glycosyltransferase family 2 protein [Gallicola sp.]|nr:glycosyltransferase family 2 protein [Gallicola sp.]
MSKNLISAVITTYKRPPKMVNRAVESVINQTYRNLEIIVVDDSPDDFKERKTVEEMILSIKEKDKRIRYIKHTENKGACAARNTGIKNSHGNFIAFLDDDDEWLPAKIEKQLKLFKEPEVGLVYCRSFTIDELYGVTKIRKVKFYKGYVFDQLFRTNFIGSTSFPLIKKECFQDCGMFDTSLKSCQDFELWLRIVKKYKVDYVDEPLVNYYIHGNERITSDPLNRIQGIMSINNKYKKYLNFHPYLKSSRLMSLIPYYLQMGEKNKAIQIYDEAVKLVPLNLKNNLKYLLHFFININKVKAHIEKIKYIKVKMKTCKN